jgi:N-acetylglucosamine malate deacetylase 2
MDFHESRFLDSRYKKLVFVAHPDDESIAASFYLQRQKNAYVVFCTNGGHTTPERLRQTGLTTLNEYAGARTSEALNALKLVPPVAGREFLGCPDGKVHLHLKKCFELLQQIAKAFKPEFILTHAFEGGHRDHDSCSFLSSQLGHESMAQVWEMPLYHYKNGAVIAQRFRDDGNVTQLTPTPVEIEGKRKMLECHRTQAGLRVFKDLGIDINAPERFRPQPNYDFLGARSEFPELTTEFLNFLATD